MRLLKIILASVLFVALPTLLVAQEHAASSTEQATRTTGEAAATHVTDAAHAAHTEHHGLPSYAVKVFSIGPVVITNSMVVTILVTLGIVFFAQLVSRNVQAIPSDLQNFAEWLVESMYNFLQEILGDKLVKKTFWFFGSIFFFILFTNWFGLLPGVGTIGWNVTGADGSHEFQPWLRGGNADLNMTSAMALLFFFLWVVWALQANGPIGFLKHIFAPGADGKGFMKWFMVAIFLFVGVLETLSILFRPVSLSFRLFGNIFAGENVLESMMNLVPWLSWLIPLPFYFLELLVGLVQALVFMLLTAVFTLLICSHEEHGPGEEHAHH
ncbi:MAG: F0F1 ATP synthase subunit A [Verrucomicrobia bacterium]|nr:F0F1 ATP synthase subunit A [Verrucomicrobiota bacterium]